MATPLVTEKPFWMRYNDVAISVVVVVILLMMVIPLPTAMLDFFLALNISVALAILLVTLYTKEALEFSVFPTLLLITTLFRLALNISATRLILLHGYAGHVIEAFGLFVVGGNYFVGLIIFLILVTIQFVVITSGAGRVAEVSARFTLDAMPGKQMSIDADLSAGSITDVQAKQRRRAIEQEADFYGSMDGSSKFVKGDAVAAMIIMVINIVGGIVIGVVQLGLPVMDAMKRFTLLTVGEGLCSQVPALLISTATGIVVTRAASDANLGDDVVKQLLGQARPLAVAAVMLFVMGLIPGLPKLPFFAIAAMLGGVAYLLTRTKSNAESSALASAELEEAEGEAKGPENLLDLLKVDPVVLSLGYDLLQLADGSPSGDLIERISAVRRQVAQESGIVVPPIRIRDNIQLRASTYQLKLSGTSVATGEVRPGRALAMDPGLGLEELEGIDGMDPAFGIPAKWIPAERRESAEMMGYTVVDCTAVIATHVSEVLKANLAELIGRQEVQQLIEHQKEQTPAVVDELLPNLMSLGEIQKVLQLLIQERVPVKNLLTILEALADHAGTTKDMVYLAECCRQALGRHIFARYAGESGELRVVTLDPTLERAIVESVQPGDSTRYPSIDLRVVADVAAKVKQEADKLMMEGREPVVLVSPDARVPVRHMLERSVPHVAVMSFAEIPPNASIKSAGVVTADVH